MCLTLTDLCVCVGGYLRCMVSSSSLSSPSYTLMVTTRSSSYVRYYLVVYNVVSALGWYAILVLSTAHLLDCLPVALVSRPSLVNQIFRFFSSFKNEPISPTFSKFQVVH